MADDIEQTVTDGADESEQSETLGTLTQKLVGLLTSQQARDAGIVSAEKIENEYSVGVETQDGGEYFITVEES